VGTRRLLSTARRLIRRQKCGCRIPVDIIGLHLVPQPNTWRMHSASRFKRDHRRIAARAFDPSRAHL
jgi:hypothetical protein